ncbi:SMC-Scp complex subunit ScpB [Stenotrophomonas sp. YIM B06876]|uniref:SMC-Scp complex subunit ScpB n=1 Tax=Stenotrophomonas sp. YIM B06876 TaxID=3060211 RepID=UPI00273A38DE|nr:SMC-Scp complex subunit ScpB [Stenotrophomonas sp. YIM B06876]
MDQSLINRIVEGALLASSQPLTLAQLQDLFTEDLPPPPGSVERALEQLREACASRGVELVEVASGFRYQVTGEVHQWVARLWTERKTRYTRATLETLALIAYRQPITRGEIEQVRGVAVSSNIIQALEEREWIRVIGHRDVPGRPALFGTTRGFLDYFGLKRLDELPPLSELKDLGELEPQLPLDRDGQLAGSISASAAPAEMGRATGDAAVDRQQGLTASAQIQPVADHTLPSHPSDQNPEAEAASMATANDAALDGEPETAPGKRAVEKNETEDNAVAKTTVAVDEADPEQQADALTAGRSQVDE